MAERLILIRHSSSLRTVTEHEVLLTLDDAERGLAREVVEVDTASFSDDVDGGEWDHSVSYLRERAGAIHRLANADPRSSELRYFGLAEIPHVIALGAFTGDERHVRVVDYDRDREAWVWPRTEQTLTVTAEPVPKERLTQAGIAVLRVSLSAAITDADVEAEIGHETLADVVVAPANGETPRVGLVRSAADLDHVRGALRSALAAILASRPGVEVIHVFVAAPVSVCFVLGQELHLRSTVPVQTYRYRRADNESSYIEAIRLTPAPEAPPEGELDPEELARAGVVRSVWEKSLKAIQRYALRLRDKATKDDVWYECLDLGVDLQHVRPFPSLPPLWNVVEQRDTVDPTPFEGEDGYENDKDDHRWRLKDRLLLALSAAAGDEATLECLVRLFLFHEYVHDYHALTKYTAREVGSYPNCLEHIDYAADLYALLHELAFAVAEGTAGLETEEQRCEYLATRIDLIVRSFRAFDEPLPRDEWQVRRVRRYLNWYWRHVQVKRAAPKLSLALTTLSRQPAIELAGSRLRVSGRRIVANLAKKRPDESLSLAVVLEDERLMRIADSVVTNLKELLSAFRVGDHTAIKQFFNAVYDEAKQWGGALPKEA